MILTKEQVGLVKVTTKGRPKEATRCVRIVRAELKACEMGGGVLVEKSEWTLKNPPTSTIVLGRGEGAEKEFSVTVKTLEDESGWLITKVPLKEKTKPAWITKILPDGRKVCRPA